MKEQKYPCDCGCGKRAVIEGMFQVTDPKPGGYADSDTRRVLFFFSFACMYRHFGWSIGFIPQWPMPKMPKAKAPSRCYPRIRMQRRLCIVQK